MMQPLNTRKDPELWLKVADGDISGAELICLLHNIIREKLQAYQNPPPGFLSDTPDRRIYRIRSCEDWLRTAGRLVQHTTSCDIRNQAVFPCLLAIGPEQTTSENFPTFAPMYIVKSIQINPVTKQEYEVSTERLYLRSDRDSYFGGALLDLSYKDIDGQIDRLKAHGMSDQIIAQCLLTRMKCQALPNNLTIYLEFFDFLNALLFGLEASRNNVCFGTSIMLLQMIQYGQMTFKQAFNENNAGKGGQYPMASIGTGTGNLASRAGLIANPSPDNIRLAMIEMSNDQKTHAVPIKEMRLIIKWLKWSMPDEHPFTSLSRANALENIVIMFRSHLIGETYSNPI